MKSFFSLFSNSSKELSKVSTLTVTGMLMALSIIFRAYMAINITPDLRVSFDFLGIMAIAMLYGPVVSVISYVGIDVIGYILDGYKARDYNFGLLAVKILIALIYGIILYKRYYSSENNTSTVKSNLEIVIRAAIARIIVVVFCQLGLNSAVLYYSYTNPNFPFMSGSEWSAFRVWMTPRIVKNALCLPVEIFAIAVILPAIYTTYRSVFGRKAAA